MTFPATTALYASINAILNILLAANVARIRTRDKVSLGVEDAGQDLLVAVRMHGSNAEFVPLALLMLLVAELCGGATVPLHVYGGMLFVGRILHVLGLPRPAPNVGRTLGNSFTWIGVVGISAYCLVLRTGH